MRIQIFIESNDQVIANRRFELKDGRCPDNIQEVIDDMITSVHNVEEISRIN